MATSVHFLRVTLATTPTAAGITEESVTVTAEDFYSPQNRCQEQLSASKKKEKTVFGPARTTHETDSAGACRAASSRSGESVRADKG